MPEEKEGFDVMEPLDVGDLSDVQKSLIPPTNGVKLRIKKVTSTANQAGTFRQLSISFVLEDGVLLGEEMKYKGAIIFMRICYFADPIAYTKDFFKTKQHLLPLKQLLKALEEDVTKVRMTDEYLESLTNRVLLGSVRQVKDNLSGDMINSVNNFKILPIDQSV